MEVIFFILAITLVFLIINLRNSVNAKFDTLQQKIDSLSNELKNARKEQLLPPRPEKKSLLEEEIIAHNVPPVQPVEVKAKEGSASSGN